MSRVALAPRACYLAHHGPSTHVRLNIYPDGGIARMRLYGIPEQA